MKAMEAAKLAKTYLSEILMDEGIVNVGLEEIEFDEHAGAWSITVGFSRPWDQERTLATMLGRLPEGDRPLRRDYRIIKINDLTGAVESIRIRDVAA